jgi:hypothetical protein
MRRQLLLASVALLAQRSAAQMAGVPAACSAADADWLAAMGSCSGGACAEAAASLTASCAAAISCEAADLLELAGAHAAATMPGKPSPLPSSSTLRPPPPPSAANNFPRAALIQRARKSAESHSTPPVPRPPWPWPAVA